ncbi:DoxX family protein [Mycobacterium sp.]|uniref:DoxX family protein n=1 Tax=Mycobacterium sp. TaxID=1785 RepID=UPI002CF9111E|nr:DoxX family protein [Mycobacterium sp.]HTY33083.1 DoxX family protein [Mycobacterium sp.]
MAPLITLLLSTIAARSIGRLGWIGAAYVNSWTAAIAVGLAAMFLLTGFSHFAPALRRDLIAIVPPRLPAPGHLVTITGLLELLGAVGLLVPATRVSAAICLLVLMLAMFPANIYASRMPHPPKSMTTRLPLRTAIQAVFLAAAVAVAVGSG